MASMVRNREFLSGLLLLVIGAVAFYMALDYPMGESRRMGPGYFPILLSATLTVIGGAIAVGAWRASGEAIDFIALRPLVCILLAVILFGVLLERAGLVLSAILVVLVSSLGGERAGIVQTLVLAIVLCSLVVAIFIYALNIPLPLWPR